MLGRFLLLTAVLAVPAAASNSRPSASEDKGRWVCVKRPAAKPVVAGRKVESKSDCRWEGKVPAALDPTPVFIL